MDTGLYHAVAAMRTSEKRLEAVAHNLANVSTRGYKREASFSHPAATGRASFSQVVAGVAADHSQGPLQVTGNPYDLALEGRGWFAIDTPDGREYARDGSFRLDDRGALVTHDGYAVAWRGSRGTVRPDGEAVVVDADGRVHQGGVALGQLEVVDFEDPALLRPRADGRWIAPQDVRERPSKAVVRQGSVEGSNVEAMDELVALITIQRSFESASTTVRAIEQSYRRLNEQR